MSTTTVNARIDTKSKEEAQGVFAKLGLSMSGAIEMFFKQVVLHQGIPFDVRIPNATTLKTIEASERGEELNEVSSVDELMKELHS